MNVNDLKSYLDKYSLSLSDSYLCAVSGGSDSMALLHLLIEAKIDIQVAHVNYNFRPKESKKEEQLVSNFCKKNNLKIQVLHPIVDSIKKDFKINNKQELASKIRYDWFTEICKKNNLKGVFVAHHMQDQVETFLFNLLRGAGNKGLGAMQAISKKNNMLLLRPLLNTNKIEINTYLKENNILFSIDSSNLVNDYSRNKIRNIIVPSLEQINAKAVNHIFEASVFIQNQNVFIANYIREIVVKIILPDKLNIIYDVRLLKELVKDYKFVLYYLLTDNGFNATQIENICSCIEINKNTAIVKSSFTTNIMCYAYNKIILTSNNNIKPIFLEIKKDELIFFINNIIKVEKNHNKTINTNSFDLDKLSDSILIRNYKTGDVIIPLGMKGKRKLLSRVFIEKKLSAIEKKQMLIIESNNSVVMAIDIVVSEKIKITNISTNIYSINRVS